MGVDVSVVMPAYDERDNLVELVPATVAELEALGRSFEVLVVDDGSTDGTREAVLAMVSDQVRYVRLRRNAGKSEALRTGFERAQGNRIVVMDADGQDDPAEIGRLLELLDPHGDAVEGPSGPAGGLDLVTGRRAERNDRPVKRQTSRLYNWTTAKVSGVPGRDFNSGLKAMTAEVAASLDLYGELHRYIPVLAHWNGFRVGEVDVSHRPRRHGHSKFGRARFWRGFLDLITVKFLTTYTARPFHLFGGGGALVGLVGVGLMAWMLVLRLQGERVGDRPALLAGILLVVVAVQLVSLGLIAELVVHLRRRRRLDAEVEP